MKFRHLLERLNYGPRAPEWPAVRKAHLILEPTCQICGGSKKLEVHHIIPYHVAPHLELKAANLITLCESKAWGVCCHLWYGHWGNYMRRYNNEVRLDAVSVQRRLQGWA